MNGPLRLRLWAWPAAALLLLAVVALVPQLGFPTTASTPLWSDHALPAAPAPVPAPNWVELAKRAQAGEKGPAARRRPKAAGEA